MSLFESRREQMFPVLSAAQVEIARRFASGGVRQFAPGEVIFDVGQVDVPFWLVLDGAIDVVRRDGLGREAAITSETPGMFSGEINQLVGRPSLAAGKASADGCTALPFDAAHLRALLVGSAEIGEIVMRALILRRVGLLESDRVGTVLVGRAGFPDLVRLQGFLARNGYPQTVLDPNSDPEARELIARLGIRDDELPLLICPNGTVLRRPSDAEAGSCLGLTPVLDPDKLYDVAVVGAGPSGLATAIGLRGLGISPVTVIEREREAGGIPRHSDHSGFGLRDLRTVLSGPRYAERYRELAADAGVEIVTETMVTGWEGERGLRLTGPAGRDQIEPPAVLLATGCRERPRSARLVPGSRPAGVMTTATLQQLVHLRGQRVGRRAVIVGAEHVSFSAVATLAHGGASVAGLVTELPRHQSLRSFRAGAAVRYRAPVWSRTAVSAIHGSDRVESVELTELDSGRTRTVECDLVIFTADWIPDHELAVMAGCELDRGSLGPLVDTALRTTRRGVFAAGNLLHPAETADVCALDGHHVAPSVAAYVRGPGEWPSSVRLAARSPLAWVMPNLLLATGRPPRDRFLLRSREFVRRPRLQVRQGGRELWSGRLRRLVPGRSAHIPADWSSQVDPAGGPVTVRVK